MILGLFVKPIFLEVYGGTCPLGPPGSAPAGHVWGITSLASLSLDLSWVDGGVAIIALGVHRLVGFAWHGHHPGVASVDDRSGCECLDAVGGVGGLFLIILQHDGDVVVARR